MHKEVFAISFSISTHILNVLFNFK